MWASANMQRIMRNVCGGRDKIKWSDVMRRNRVIKGREDNRLDDITDSSRLYPTIPDLHRHLLQRYLNR